MALEIFRLIGSIFVNTDDADESISKTDKKAEGLGNTLLKGVGTAAKWGAAIVGGASAAATAVVGMANSTAATADTIDKASIRMGVSAEYYQELAYAAGQCGVETAALEKAAKKLEGTDINMEDAMKQIMSMGTAEERATKAAELFGDTVAYTLSPLIEQSDDDFNGLIGRANELGLVMSGDAVSAGVKLGDTMADIQKSFGAMATSIGSAVLPMVQEFADTILKFLPDIQGILSGLIPMIMALSAALLPPLMGMVQSILPVLIDFIGQIMPVITEVMQTILPVVVELLNMLLPPMLQIVQSLLPVILSLLDAVNPVLNILLGVLEPILELLTAILTPVIELVSELLQPAIDLVVTLLDKALAPLVPVISELGGLLKDVLATAFKNLQPIVISITNVFKGLIQFINGVFTGNWRQAWSGVINIFKNLFEGIVNIVRAPLNTVITGINKVFSSMGQIEVPDWVPGIGGSKFSLPQIPMLAKGGTTTSDGRVLVGEKGPEFLDLPKGATVTPLDKAGNIDYDEMERRMEKAFMSALQKVSPELVEIVPDPDGMFTLMRRKNREFKKMNGDSAFA